MAPKKKPLDKLKPTARYYRTGSTKKGKGDSKKASEARKKKNATTHKNNQKPERKRKWLNQQKLEERL